MRQYYGSDRECNLWFPVMDSFHFPYAGELAALLTTLCWTVCIFPFTIASRKLGAAPLNHLRLLMATTILTVVVLFISDFPEIRFYDEQGLTFFSWFCISGVIGLALGDYFGFSGFAILGPRIGSVFTTLAPAATLLSGYFYVNERINVVGIIGILITLGSVAVLSLSGSEINKVKQEGFGSFFAGVIFMILSSFCQGFGLVLANKGFEMAGDHPPDPFQATWIRMMAGTLIIFAVTILSGKIRSIAAPILRNEGNGNAYALLGTLFGPVTGVMFSMLALSLLKNQPSIAQTIFSLLPVFALPVNRIVYKERITLKQILIVLGACAGVIILVWRNVLIEYL